ncbi:metallo-beta-lactamase domain protein [delta proteobacterium NaphS2]|nr:metallo-beta-lactamase domain protein [delta proteobacterium NaphS2]
MQGRGNFPFLVGGRTDSIVWKGAALKIGGKGRIRERFYVLGHPHFPVYFLDGETPVLFDAGITALGRRYEADLKPLLGGRTPEYLFLTHSHFDHVGAAAHFKRIWPKMKIACSARAVEILARPGVIRRIRDLNSIEIQKTQSLNGTTGHEDRYEPFEVDLVLSPGHKLQLEQGLSVKALYTPGHTWDFMSYWVAQKRLLVGSEAVGTDHGNGFIMSDFPADYDAFCRSLEYLSHLDVEILCQGHVLVLTDEDARTHLQRSLRQAVKVGSMIEEFLRAERGNIERTVSRLKAVEFDVRFFPNPSRPI